MTTVETAPQRVVTGGSEGHKPGFTWATKESGSDGTIPSSLLRLSMKLMFCFWTPNRSPQLLSLSFTAQKIDFCVEPVTWFSRDRILDVDRQNRVSLCPASLLYRSPYHNGAALPGSLNRTCVCPSVPEKDL